MNPSKLTAVLGVMGISLLACPSSPAQPAAVALVLESDGPIEPSVVPFTELRAGLALALDDDSTLLFNHYPTCREVLVRGGLVVFTEQSFQVRTGEVLRETRVGCPQTIELAWDGEVAGLTMRSLTGTVVSPAAEFVLVGKAPRRFARWRILRDDEAVVEGRVVAPRIALPRGQPPLEGGRSYVLELVGAGDDDTRRVPFAVSEGGRARLTVIRLD